MFANGCLVTDLVFADSFPSTFEFEVADADLRTPQLCRRINMQIQSFRKHPAIKKVNPLILKRLEYLEMVVEGGLE